jgi:hypothetical protein
MSSRPASHLVAPFGALAVSDKIAAVRGALAECLLPQVEVAEDTAGRDFGFCVRGARADEVARAIGRQDVRVETLPTGSVLAWFRIA